MCILRDKGQCAGACAVLDMVNAKGLRRRPIARRDARRQGGETMSISLWIAITGGAVLAAMLTGPAAAAPSFDCAKASNAIERAVCADEEFAAMDLELAGVYQRALIVVGRDTADGHQIVRDQRRWLTMDRNSCASIPESDYRFLQCIGNSYGRRIAELRALIERGGAADAASGDAGPSTRPATSR
jgi:uncharacterized protein YecT (DUF1311 family)